MKKLFVICLILFVWSSFEAAAQSSVLIESNSTNGIFSAHKPSLTATSDNTSNPPVAPTSGTGTRLMWIPSRSAFRVGTVLNDYWDAANIGLFSFASGFGTKASGYASVAMGQNSNASGNNSTAMGVSNASGYRSTAMGASTTTISAYYSTAMGGSTANGEYSTAMGQSTTTINGQYSIAMGRSTASEEYSTAMGHSTASGANSTAMGYFASTNGKTHSFAIGGHSSNANPQVANTADYQMMMAFHNYRFWTQNAGTFVDFGPSGEVTATGPYNNVSDRRLKKDFKPLANSLSNLLKTNTYHYYWKSDSTLKDLQTGVIAQELRELFPELVHKDDKGLLSVNYIGLIPHLIEAVKELKVENEILKGFFGKKIAELEAHNDDLSATIKKINAQFNLIQNTNR
jgi:hypothetical protein